MIIVTGATGKLGHLIVEKLAGLVPPETIGVSVRDTAKARRLTDLGVRVRHGDFDHPDSLRHAFEGASQVLIISSNARAYGGDTLAQHRAAIDGAVAVGARRILYTSHMAASGNSAFPPARDHAATEDMLACSGIAWTALRHGFYAESGAMMIKDAAQSGLIEAPVDGKVSWTTHEDLAEADALIVADEGRFDGPTPPLTGAEALDMADIAAILSDLSGRPVERRMLNDEDFKGHMTARGAPGGAIAIALGLYVAARGGEFAVVHVHPDPNELGRVYHADLPICADMSEFCEMAADWHDPELVRFSAGEQAHAEWLEWSDPKPRDGVKLDLGVWSQGLMVRV